MNHFFTEPGNIADGKIYISGSDVNHIKNVLRMKPDEELLISDGTGKDYLCRISDINEKEIICQIISEDVSRTEPTVKFFLFQGLPKADKMEMIIQKSVELGVYEIIPVETSRSVVKYDDKKKRSRQERWQKIAEGAAKQSGRGIIPQVDEIMSFKNALKMAENLDMILIPYENFKDMKATRETIASIKPGMSVGIFIGPEGGFAGNEVDSATEAGAYQLCLGSRILRTETAPLMLLSVLMFALEE